MADMGASSLADGEAMTEAARKIKLAIFSGVGLLVG